MYLYVQIYTSKPSVTSAENGAFLHTYINLIAFICQYIYIYISIHVCISTHRGMATVASAEDGALF